MRILVVRLGAFGDILHTMPMVADLVAAGHTVDWLCEERWQSLLVGSPAIHRVIPIPLKAWRSRGGDIRRCLRVIRQTKYDAVIDAQGRAKSALISALSGCRLRIGPAGKRATEQSWLLHNVHAPITGTHVIDQNRCLALPITGNLPTQEWQFPLPNWGDITVPVLPEQDKPIWGLNVGANWPTKVWPIKRQIEFAQTVHSSGRCCLIIWGGAQEREFAQRIHDAVPQAIMAPATDLPQLARLIQQCEIVISGDTGPLHLVRALQIPAVGLFGPVPANRNGVVGPHYTNIQSRGALWERSDMSKVHMDEITANMVMTAAERIIHSIK